MSSNRTYQVIEQRHDVVLARSHAAVVISLEGTHRVVAIHSTPALLVQTTDHTEGVIREEATVIKGDTEKLSHC